MSTIIALSGKSGCGNSTVSRLLSERLGLKLINYTFRSMAEERGVTLERILELAAFDPSYDRDVDTRQVELARAGDCVIGSRLAMWLLPEADLRIYLWAGTAVRASRIHAREGGNLAEVLAFTERRDAQDHERYLRLYGIDNDDYSGADLVVNTERFGPEAIVALVTKALEI